MKTMNPTIKKLLEQYQELSLVGKIQGLLGWDLNVNLPQKAAVGRSKQSAYMTKLATDLWNDKKWLVLIEKAQAEEALTEEEKAIVRNVVRAAEVYTKVPKKILIKKEEVTSQAFMVWQEARAKKDFALFAPYLSQIIDLNREISEHLGFAENIYDPHLDLHEQDLTAALCDKWFGELKPALISLTKRIQQSKAYTDPKQLISSNATYSQQHQEKLATFILEKMGFDAKAGRLDTSAHPFTIALGPEDVRVTTRYRESDFIESFIATMHEGGHALYEQGIDPSFSSTPLENGVSFGIHEAMSRFYENQIGKNPAFLSYMLPEFKTYYKEQLANIDEDGIAKLFNWVTPSPIRIEADEVTYSLHIVLRFEIENELINKRIKVDDAPEVWNAKMKEYFGITPKDNSEGILQDVHWSYGEFGYFPAYALGNLYASQLFSVMKKDINVEKELAQGNLLPITKWLKDHVYTYGSLYYPQDLIQKETGAPLNASYFINYLEEKYTALYHLK